MASSLHVNGMAKAQPNPFLKRRQDLDLTQIDAALRCRVEPSPWRNWERGRSVPSRWRYQAICTGLEWTLDQLLDAVSELSRQAVLQHG